MKSLLKQVFFGAGLTLAFPLHVLSLSLDRMTGGDNAFVAASQFLSMWPGRIGVVLRRGFYMLALRKCSRDTTVDFGTTFSSRDVEVGDHVYIGSFCIVSKSTIGPDTIIGSYVSVTSGKSTHNFSDPSRPIRLQGGRALGVNIGRDCWIGNHTVLMADVGDGCVVGAGSVVTKNIESMHVAAGNPARTIRKR